MAEMTGPYAARLQELSRELTFKAETIVRYFRELGMTEEEKVQFLAKEFAGLQMYFGAYPLISARASRGKKEKMTETTVVSNPEISIVGVVGVLSFPDGRALASVSDFDTSGYGGFTLHESQERRTKSALAREVVDKLCSDHVLKAIDPYLCEQILSALIKTGFLISFIRIGQDRK